MVQSQFFHDLAWDPRRKVLTWRIYFVNDFKFHIEEWSIGKQTISYGVSVKCDPSGDEEMFIMVTLKILCNFTT